jgi:hypothetical protein
MRQFFALQGHTFFQVYMKVEPYKYGIKMFQLCMQKVATFTTWKYVLTHIPLTRITALHSLLATGSAASLEHRAHHAYESMAL